MASPVDAGRVVTNQTAVRPTSVNLPAGIVAGDLLIVAARGGGTITMLLPAGWSWLVQNDQTDASDDTVSIIYKRADGSEGTTLTWDQGFAIKGCTIAWRITGAENPAIRAPEVVAASFVSSANTADPPAISPTGGSKDYLFLAIANKDGIQAFTAAPAGYTNFTPGSGSTGGSPATNATAAGASKAVTAVSENPGVFTHGAATTGGRAFTIAIHPGPTTQFGVVSSVITFGRSVAGSKRTFGQLVRPFTFQVSVTGNVFIPAVTYYGSLAMPITFGAAVNGRRKTFGQIVAPFIFLKDVRGQRKTFGKTALAINASIVTSGIRLAQTLYGMVTTSIAFGSIISGSRKTFGQIAAPFIFAKDVQGQRKTFGQVAAPFIFSKDVRGQRKTFGQTAFPIAFSSTTSGFRVGLRLYGVVALPITFGKDVKGQRRALGQVAMPIIFAKDVKGVRRTSGQVAMSIIFAKDVKAQRKTFAQISASFIFDAVIQGRKRTFSKIAFPIGFNIDVKTGRVGVHDRIAFPIIVDFKTFGITKISGIVLNDAIALYLGEQNVNAVYVGDEKVWGFFDPMKISGLAIWFDVSQLNLINGAVVNPWQNLANGSLPGTIVGTPFPVVRTKALNGRSVVRFKVNEGRLRINGTGISLDYTLIYVGRMVGSALGRVVSGIYTPNNILFGFWNGYQDVAYDAGFLMPDVKVGQTTNWKLYSVDATTGPPIGYAPRLLSDGVLLCSSIGGSGWGGSFAISGYSPAGVEETCDCEIAEVLFYNRKLLDTDRQQVEAYLRKKWGL